MKRPTDLELMAFADGELDPDRAAEISAFLAERPDAGEVVEAVRDLGDHVRHAAIALDGKPAEGAADIADDVMAAIARLEAASRNAASIPPPTAHRSVRPATAGGRVSSSPARGRVAPPAAIVALLAVAAGVFVWSRASVPDSAIGPVASFAPAVESLPDPGDDRAPGAQIDAVDFGGNQGAVFYVPGQANTATAVVWIAEEPQ